jgi:hypothetical protein
MATPAMPPSRLKETLGKAVKYQQALTAFGVCLLCWLIANPEFLPWPVDELCHCIHAVLGFIFAGPWPFLIGG